MLECLLSSCPAGVPRRPVELRQTLIGLGLNKMHKTRELEDTPAIRGMVNKIPHLVEIVEERG